MYLKFLGTGSQYPSKYRGVSCTALRLQNGEVWLFDCGEGSQIQIQKSDIKAAKISKIFITHLHGDHLFGLPGLLCSIGAWDVNKSKVIEIYGPLGIRNYLCANLLSSYSQFENLKFTVKEFAYDTFTEDESQWKEWDSLLNTLPSLKHPNVIEAAVLQPNSVGIYTCYENEGTSVKAGFLKHRVPCFGYVIEEGPIPGRLDANKLASLGVKPGPLYQQIKDGKSITTESGRVIESSEVLGTPIPGRKITILGDTCDSSSLLNMAMNSDVLVHEATLQNSLQEKAVENGHSTPGMAAAFAKSICAKTLILTHFSQRYKSLCSSSTEHVNNFEEETDSVLLLLKEAKSAVSDETFVVVADDFYNFNVEKKVSTLEPK